MNVIANAGAIRRWIILTKNRNAGPLPQRDLQSKRDQTSLRVMILANVAIRTCPRCVEITQRSVSNSVGIRVIRKHAFDDKLGKTIRIDRRLRFPLCDRNNLRLTISRTGAGKNDLRDLRLPHRFKERERGDHIILVVLRRILHGFTHQGRCGKMDHGVNLVIPKDRGYQRAILQISFN